jgi:osmotically-inducible protein OsmY
MIDSEAALEEVRRALRREPRIDFDHHLITLTFANGELLLSGEVGDITAKRLAVERAARAPSVTVVFDELRVRPVESIPDDEIRDLLRRALVEEPALAGCTMREHIRGQLQVVHAPLTSVGRIDLAVTRGVVTLAGEVPSLAQKRLAGALAWWVPGTGDVINTLAVQPPEEDSDDAICDAVRLVLDRDPAVHAAGIQVDSRDGVVRLDGTIPSASERTSVGHDAWYVWGVRDVIDHLTIRA